MTAPDSLAEIYKLLNAGGLPELGPGPRSTALPLAELESALDKILQSSHISPQNAALLRAVLLLWHDHLDAAHQIAQTFEDSDGSFVHGIIHRREPDYANAKYWFRRTGRHRSFPRLAAVAEAVLAKSPDQGLHKKLLPGGEWAAYAFVDLCAGTAHSSATPAVAILRELQGLESKVLLQDLLG